MEPALIGALGGILGTLATVGLALRQTREARRQKLLERELNAEDLLTRYREPLAAAAFDLQSRCWNIVRNNFFGKFDREHDRFPEAQMTTLFRFAQYFGWAEILRREIQYLSFPEEQDTKDVAKLLSAVAARLALSEPDETLMIWVDEQRAIGERMIVEGPTSLRCMGYAAFCDAYDECFRGLFKRVIEDLDTPPAKTRLREVQHLLCELVGQLDKKGLRYAPEQLGPA